METRFQGLNELKIKKEKMMKINTKQRKVNNTSQVKIKKLKETKRILFQMKWQADFLGDSWKYS